MSRVRLTTWLIGVSTRFCRNKRGNFAVIFALSAPVLILFAGMGADYLEGLSFKSRWDAAADAAALAAVQGAEDYAKANATQSASTLSAAAISAGQAQGYKAFKANAGVSESTGSVTPTMSVTQAGMTFTATANYSGSVATHFGGLVGVTTIGAAGSSTASGTMTTYINYYIILDTSESMGVGATTTDMTNLFNRTQAYGNATDGETGCVLACHVTTGNNNGTHQTYSNEYLAHDVSPNITLRIDAAKTAIQSVITQALPTANTGNIKIGLYTLQSYSSGGTANPEIGPFINTISTPTTDFATLGTLLGNIDLASPDPSYGWGNSDFSNSLNYFNSQDFASVSTGNGYSSATPLNYVLIITDGVQDVYGPTCYWDHCTQHLDPSLCTQFKSKATVGVVYTTYLPFYKNNNPGDGYDTLYSNIIAPIASQIAPNLQSCATSSQYYYEATDGAALSAAMAALFTTTSQPLRLTQ